MLADFSTYKTDQRVACILVNNTQQLRVQLEKVYENMARERLVFHFSYLINFLMTIV